MDPKIWEILAALKELEYMTNALNGPTNALKCKYKFLID